MISRIALGMWAVVYECTFCLKCVDRVCMPKLRLLYCVEGCFTLASGFQLPLHCFKTALFSLFPLWMCGDWHAFAPVCARPLHAALHLASKKPRLGHLLGHHLRAIMIGQSVLVAVFVSIVGRRAFFNVAHSGDDPTMLAVAQTVVYAAAASCAVVSGVVCKLVLCAAAYAGKLLRARPHLADVLLFCCAAEVAGRGCFPVASNTTIECHKLCCCHVVLLLSAAQDVQLLCHFWQWCVCAYRRV
jgi:hypothetical protein